MKKSFILVIILNTVFNLSVKSQSTAYGKIYVDVIDPIVVQKNDTIIKLTSKNVYSITKIDLSSVCLKDTQIVKNEAIEESKKKKIIVINYN